MTYSAGDTGTADYAIGYATASSPLVPWTKSAANSLLKTNGALGVTGPAKLDRSLVQWQAAMDRFSHPLRRRAPIL